MATVKLLLGIFCIAVTCSFVEPGSNLLSKRQYLRYNTVLESSILRARILDIARREIGVRELTNHNDGQQVEAYLACTGLKKGEPWCAAFVAWVFKQAGYSAPRSAWSPDLFPNWRVVKVPAPGDVLGVYFPNLKRIAHVGIIEMTDGDWCVTVEGNTNVNGSREGNGVYRKRRPMRSLYRVADWLKTKNSST